MVKRTKTPARAKLQGLLRDLKNTTVKVGYFANQGKHHSGMNYPTLMFIHEVRGVHSATKGKILRRPFEITMMKKGTLLMDFLQAKLVRNVSTLTAPESTLEAFAQKTVQEIQAVFGDSSLLEPNSPVTIKHKGFDAPLIETAELKNHLTYRINKKGK